jgi:hypothetical protein
MKKVASNSKEIQGYKGLLQEQELRKHKGEGIHGEIRTTERINLERTVN